MNLRIKPRRRLSFADARAFCPDLISQPARPDLDAGFRTVLRRWATCHCPWVGYEGADGLVLDVTGAAHLWGGDAGMLTEMRMRANRAGLELRLGLGETRGAAWARTHFGDEESTLTDLPVAALRLDEEGRAYHAAVSRAFSQLREATAALRSAPSRVTISVTPTFASKWLIPRLAEFTQAYPDIDLRITATERVSSFHADGIDLAIRQGRPPFGASLCADLLFRQEVVAVCAPHLSAAQDRPLDAAALSSMTLLHDTHDLWPKFTEVAFGDEVDLSHGLWFNQTTLTLDAALAGQGIALASRFLVLRDLKAGHLVQPLDGALEGGLNFYLLTSRQGASDASLHVRDWLLGMTNEGA